MTSTSVADVDKVNSWPKARDNANTYEHNGALPLTLCHTDDFDP